VRTAHEARLKSSGYFFAFFFDFLTFFFTTFLAFFFATFGMRSDSSYECPGRATHAAPQNANNMSGLRSRMQYTPAPGQNASPADVIKTP
jgi:hypothetical protein